MIKPFVTPLPCSEHVAHRLVGIAKTAEKFAAETANRRGKRYLLQVASWIMEAAKVETTGPSAEAARAVAEKVVKWKALVMRWGARDPEVSSFDVSAADDELVAALDVYRADWREGEKA